MPIIDIQRRLREIGRVRIGQQVPIENPKGKAKSRPVKLETFRLTSRDRRVIDAAAALYGGKTQPWAEQAGQWEIVTETAEMPILIPPGGLALTQWYELWSGGGCQRRCDGQTELIGDQTCVCDPEHRDCSIHTRLSVVLSDLQGLGVWRLDTQGWYAATEIGSVVPLLEGAAERGKFLPARLRLEQRRVLRNGKTFKFAVPVIDIDVTIGQMRALVSGPAEPVTELANPITGELESASGLTPMPDAWQPPTVGDQLSAADTAPSRQRKDTPQLPPSGVRIRTRAEAEDADGDRAVLAPPNDPDAGDTNSDAITEKQRRMIFALLNGLKVAEAERHEYAGVALGRELASFNDLTKDDATRLIDKLKQPAMATAAVDGDGEPF